MLLWHDLDMPKKKDANQVAESLLRAATRGRRVRGEYLLGSPQAKRLLREARASAKKKGFLNEKNA